MVRAVDGGAALEIASTKGQQGASFNSANSTDPTVTLHPPMSPYTLMAGSIISAVLVSGINSNLPRPIPAQVRENALDTPTRKNPLVPPERPLKRVHHKPSPY